MTACSGAPDGSSIMWISRRRSRACSERSETGGQDAREELEALRKMEEEQLACFDDDIRYMTQAVDTLTAGLKTAKEVLNF